MLHRPTVALVQANATSTNGCTPIIFRDWEQWLTFFVIDHEFTRGWTRPNLEPPIFQGLRPLPLSTFGSLLWRHRVYYTVQTARSARFFFSPSLAPLVQRERSNKLYSARLAIRQFVKKIMAWRRG